MKRKSKKLFKRIILTLVCSIVLLIAIGAIYFFGVLGSAKRAASSSFAPLKTTENVNTAKNNLGQKKPFSLLIMGVDSRDQNLSGRSDTMIVATVNPKKGITLVSIPRDTYVQGTSINKINSAYADGGAANAISHVNSLLNIKLQHYITINFDGLVELVNEVGGISVNSELDFTSSHTTQAQGNQNYHFSKGLNHLNGEQALAYSRERYNDPNGDYGRQMRQQQVIEALLKKLETAKTLTNYHTIFNVLSANVKTDFSWDSLNLLFKNYHQALGQTQSTTLKGSGQTINGLSYQIVAQPEIERVHDIIENQIN